jgi:hypothetical protein
VFTGALAGDFVGDFTVPVLFLINAAADSAAGLLLSDMADFNFYCYCLLTLPSILGALCRHIINNSRQQCSTTGNFTPRLPH